MNKKKNSLFFISRSRSTIDKKWKKSRIPGFLYFSLLCDGFVFYCNIILAVFYLVGNANVYCADKQILNNNYNVFKRLRQTEY